MFQSNRWLGYWEYLVGPGRNLVLGLYALTYLIIYGIVLIFYPSSLSANKLLLPAAIVILCTISRHQKLLVQLKISEILRAQPDLEPAAFFDLVHQNLGPWPETPDLNTLPKISPLKTSFLQEKRPHQSAWLLLPAMWDTMFLAHTSLKTLEYMTRDFARDVFGVMASMWGKRVLQIFRGALTVTGSDKLEKLPGKIILIFNHKSQLDFALTFYALSGVRLPSGREVRPRFITARDHFLDNPFIYRIMGIGRLIETVDMIFIDRKKAGKGFQNLKQAADFLANKEIDVAIFPQGTRAEGNIDRSEKRRDAGYYTTVSPKDIELDLGHLRKGTAYLAVDTLIEMAKKRGGELPCEHDQLHLVFVGIAGTATTMAKQSFKVQTQNEIHYHVGDVLTLHIEQAQDLQKPEQAQATNPQEERYLSLVEEVNREIDASLAHSVGIAHNLIHRYMLDLKGPLRLPRERLDMLERQLKAVVDKQSLPFQILDRIYACPTKDWNGYLSEFTQILLDGQPENRLRQLRTNVTIKMLESIKSKTHGKKIQKKELQAVET